MLFYLIFIAGFILSPYIVYAASATLSWDPSSYQGLAGYKIYYGNESRNYVYPPIDVGKSTQHIVRGLYKDDKYYFAVTAYTYDGVESAFSSEVSSRYEFDGTAILFSRQTADSVCDMQWDTGETINVYLSFSFLRPFLPPQDGFIFETDDDRITCLEGTFTQNDDNTIEAECVGKDPYGIFTLYVLTFEGTGNVLQKDPLSLSAELYSIFNWECPLYVIEMKDLLPVQE